ncbi:MAG: hypothetical protein ACXQTI_06605 [Candidatus Nezhaarchaeales archaeon]
MNCNRDCPVCYYCGDSHLVCADCVEAIANDVLGRAKEYSEELFQSLRRDIERLEKTIEELAVFYREFTRLLKAIAQAREGRL